MEVCDMNITLSIKDDLLKKARGYAAKHNTTLNALIRDMLEKIVGREDTEKNSKILFDLMDSAKGNSRGKKWSREDLYEI
jgi:hypothetical protein